MDKTKKIYIAGHRGMVGSAIKLDLESNSFTNIITASSNELDLRNQNEVDQYIETHKPDVVIIAAAR